MFQRSRSEDPVIFFPIFVKSTLRIFLDNEKSQDGWGSSCDSSDMGEWGLRSSKQPLAFPPSCGGWRDGIPTSPIEMHVQGLSVVSPSIEDFIHDAPRYVRQSEVAARVAIRQLLVV